MQAKAKRIAKKRSPKKKTAQRKPKPGQKHQVIDGLLPLLTPIAELTLDDANARVHTDRQVKTIAASLRQYGQPTPLVAHAETKRVLKGNGTLLAAQSLGWTHVAVAWVSYDPDTARGYALADNRASDLARWDIDRLNEQLDALGEKFDRTAYGVTDADLKRLRDQQRIAASGDEPEELPEAPEPQIDRADELQKKWNVKTGDLFEIAGPSGMVHRLLCGDSTVKADVERVLEGETCDVCFTSPPYAQQRNYTKPIDDWDRLMQGVFGNIPANDTTQVLVNLGLIHRDGEWIPYWDGWIEWMRGQGWKRYGWYVWDKSCGGREDGCRLPNAHEFVWHFCQQPIKPDKCEPCVTAGKRTSVPLMYSDTEGQYHSDDKTITRNDLRVRGSVCRLGRAAEPVEGHPAAYPSRLVTYFIEHWPGTVYDPFLGSGTTLVACEQLGRRGFGIEIAPKYVAVSLERLAEMGCVIKQAG